MISLTKRYCVEFDDGSRECGFDDNGFWYSDVCLAHHPVVFTRHRTNKITERHNRQMDYPGSFLSHILRLVCRRPHPRKATSEEGPTVALIPSRTLPLFSNTRNPSYTNGHNSSSYPTLNAAVMVRSPRTTSPSTKRKTPTHLTHPTRNTHKDRTAHGQNPRRCTRTLMHRPNTSRPLLPAPPR